MQDTATSVCKPAHATYRQGDWVESMVDDYASTFVAPLTQVHAHSLFSHGLVGAVHDG